jgi:hypothetical protein
LPFRPDHWFHWQPFSRLVPAKGRRWQGWGTAFKGKNSQLRCTLLGYWGEEHQDPWLVLTDLAPECAEACWYDLRAWKEQIFKRSKRSDYWWLLSAGGEVEAQADTPLDIPEPLVLGAENAGE